MIRSALTLFLPLLIASGSVDPSMQDAYENIGAGDPENPCRFNMDTARCPNDVSKFQWLFKFIQKKQLGGRFDAIPWGTSSPVYKRKPASGTDSAQLSIAPIRDARRMFLKDNNRWLDVAVVAVLTVAQNSPEDALFGIGGSATENYQNRFFLVTSRFSPTVDSKDSVSRRIGKWMIFGTTKDGKLRKLPKEGAFRWCAKGHAPDDYPTGASFSTCPTDVAMAAIAERADVKNALNGQLLLSAISERLRAADERSVLQALTTGRLVQGVMFSTNEVDTMLKAYRDTFDAPAWLTCGVGCCVAEDF